MKCKTIKIHNLSMPSPSLKLKDKRVLINILFSIKNNYIPSSRSLSGGSGSSGSDDDSNGSNRSVTLRDLYSLRQVLSDTSNGTVFSGRRRRDGRPVAIKRIMRNKVKRWGIVRDRQVPMEVALLRNRV